MTNLSSFAIVLETAASVQHQAAGLQALVQLLLLLPAPPLACLLLLARLCGGELSERD
jgi:hypothetical protein